LQAPSLQARSPEARRDARSRSQAAEGAEAAAALTWQKRRRRFRANLPYDACDGLRIETIWSGRPMSVQVKKFHAALKHGAFSATAILPGEDPIAFKELHQKLIAELAPVEALEDHFVWTIARLVGRKEHLATFRIEEMSRESKRKNLSSKCSKWKSIPRNDAR